MLRARLEFFRAEEHRLCAQFAARTDADPIFSSESSGHPASRGRTMGQLIDAYRLEFASHWSPSTEKNYAVTIRAVEELIGRSRPLCEVGRDECREVRDVLARLPPNYRKRPETRHLSRREAAAWAERLRVAPVKPATLNAYVAKLSAILDFGVREEWLASNSARRLSVRDPVPPQEKRASFTTPQLNRIFHAPPWNGPPQIEGANPARYWVPLLALFTGARAGELCQLRASDIEERAEALIIQVRPGERRRLKTNSSSRVIPIHPELITLGLVAYLEQVWEAGHERLFPEVSPDSLGRWSHTTSEWFSKHLKRISVSGTRLGLHSFRHNWEDAQRECGLAGTPLGLYLSGRAGGGSEADYGSGYSSFTLRLVQAVERITYPRLT